MADQFWPLGLRLILSKSPSAKSGFAIENPLTKEGWHCVVKGLPKAVVFFPEGDEKSCTKPGWVSPGLGDIGSSASYLGSIKQQQWRQTP